MAEPFLDGTVSMALSGTAIASVITHAVTLWFRERGANQRMEHDQHERLGQTLAQWADQARREGAECMERWNESQMEIRALASDLAAVRADHSNCHKKQAILEEQVRGLMYRTPDAIAWARLQAEFPDNEKTPTDKEPNR